MGRQAVLDSQSASWDNGTVTAPATSPGINKALLFEQRYRRSFLAADSKLNSATILLCSLGTCLLVVNDLRLLNVGLSLYACLAARLLLVVVALIAQFALRRARWPRQQDRACSLWFGAAVVALIITNLTRLPSGEYFGSLFGLGIWIGMAFFAMRGPLLPRVLAALAGVGVLSCLLWNPKAALTPAGRITSTISSFMLIVIGVVSVRTFEEQRRKRFIAEQFERQARRELAGKLRELAEAKEHAEAVSRARTAFLAAMSHEFRTPMNAVIGLSDLVLSAPLNAPLDGENRRHIRAISESARALLGILNNILDFAAMDAQRLTLHPAPFNIRQLIESISAMLHPAAKQRGLDVSIALSQGVSEWMVGDEARLRQVLVNLLSNAIKFTERGEVRLQIVEQADESQERPAQTLAFCVEDTGIGIPADVIARLFRPFERAEGGVRRYSGTGLGLAISRQIVLAMGSDIKVESTHGQGSRFSFTLRLPVAAAPAQTQLPNTSVTLSEARKLSLLVVDDSSINRLVASKFLEKLGHDADLATNGVEAVELAARKHYDVIFMDIQMPGMDGIAASKRIRASCGNGPTPRIVAMTAGVYDDDREACRNAGMSEFLGKPIDFASIAALLTRVIADHSDRHVPVPKSAS